MAGLAIIIYAHHVETPLARGWHTAQILARDQADFALFVAVDGHFGGLDVARNASPHFDKREDVLVPADQINFATPPRSPEIGLHYHVTQGTQIEISIFFFAPAGMQVRGTLIGRQSLDRKPVEGSLAPWHASFAQEAFVESRGPAFVGDVTTVTTRQPSTRFPSKDTTAECAKKDPKDAKKIKPLPKLCFPSLGDSITL